MASPMAFVHKKLFFINFEASYLLTSTHSFYYLVKLRMKYHKKRIITNILL